jgi:hypothetical protein
VLVDELAAEPAAELAAGEIVVFASYSCPRADSIASGLGYSSHSWVLHCLLDASWLFAGGSCSLESSWEDFLHAAAAVVDVVAAAVDVAGLASVALEGAVVVASSVVAAWELGFVVCFADASLGRLESNATWHAHLAHQVPYQVACCPS